MQIHDVGNLKTAIVAASHHRQSDCLRLATVLRDRFLIGNADLIDLQTADLPFWCGESESSNSVIDVTERLAQADALIFVVEEWNASAPASIRNMLLWASAEYLAHKPVLLVAVSSGAGGAAVLADLRMGSQLNSRLLYLPEHLLIRDAGRVWNDSMKSTDAYLAGRTQYCIDQLLIYACSLKPVRDSLCMGLIEFPYGME